jgi:hypothetical protein
MLCGIKVYSATQLNVIETGFIMTLTTNPGHPDLQRKIDESPVSQRDTYLVLSDEEIAKGFIKPVRRSYTHKTCGTVTTCAKKLAETLAADPSFYRGAYCVSCRKHRLLNEFTWLPDGEEMDPDLQVIGD